MERGDDGEIVSNVDNATGERDVLGGVVLLKLPDLVVELGDGDGVLGGLISVAVAGHRHRGVGEGERRMEDERKRRSSF